jgi:protein pelota
VIQHKYDLLKCFITKTEQKNKFQHAEIAAVVMQEGLANICLVTSSMTIVRAKIEVAIPRKRKGHAQQHEKVLKLDYLLAQQIFSFFVIIMQGLQRFFDSVMQSILRHVNFEVVKCVLIASPGFVRDQFMEYMMQEASKTDNKILIDNRSKFLLVHASSGFKHSLRGNKKFQF